MFADVHKIYLNHTSDIKRRSQGYIKYVDNTVSVLLKELNNSFLPIRHVPDKRWSNITKTIKNKLSRWWYWTSEGKSAAEGKIVGVTCSTVTDGSPKASAVYHIVGYMVRTQIKDAYSTNDKEEANSSWSFVSFSVANHTRIRFCSLGTRGRES